MKRFILLLGMAVFTIIVISSCTCMRDLRPELQDKHVSIITRYLPGNKPQVTPPVVRLQYGKDQQVIWTIDDPELEFTIKFNKNGYPFKEKEFHKKRPKSGRPVVDPGERPKFYYYSVEVDGFESIDPAIIIRR